MNDDLRAFRGLALALPLGCLLWALLLWGCASHDPTVESALRAYDRAAAMKLAAERPVIRPYARTNDGAPWSQVRRVEIDK